MNLPNHKLFLFLITFLWIIVLISQQVYDIHITIRLYQQSY